MLEELEIRDFALIEHVRVPFTQGLNVLTGETGAGKSILLDALNAVLGGKIAGSTIRPGAEKAVIEATFKQVPVVSAWLKQHELMNEDTDTLFVSRELTRSGSRLRINGTLVNVALVSELRQKLISLHAQHEARTLLSPQSQLEMLDGLGDVGHKKQQELVRTLYTRKRELTAQLKEIQISEEERLRLLDFSRYQLTELLDAALSDAHEDDRLSQECQILENLAVLETYAAEAQGCLNGSSEESSLSAVDLLQEALAQVEKASATDTSLTKLADSLRDSLEIVEEAARHLRRYRDALDTDPESLSNLQARLAQLAAIKRKYGPELKDAIARQKELETQVEKLEGSQAAVAKLEQEVADLDKKLNRAASELSAARRKLGKTLGQQIQSELAELGMERCRFEIAFEECEAGPSGVDRIEFLLSPNPGQPLLPVTKIASGGELSRVMLAVKSIFAAADQVATVIFDEIDTGLSGKVLQSMRDKLARLADSHQILCITHQPIIASIADNHVLVRKEQTSNSTAVSVSTLDQKQRVSSLAEMASGTNEKEALRFAAALIEEASRLRK